MEHVRAALRMNLTVFLLVLCFEITATLSFQQGDVEVGDPVLRVPSERAVLRKYLKEHRDPQDEAGKAQQIEAKLKLGTLVLNAADKHKNGAHSMRMYHRCERLALAVLELDPGNTAALFLLNVARLRVRDNNPPQQLETPKIGGAKRISNHTEKQHFNEQQSSEPVASAGENNAKELNATHAGTAADGAAALGDINDDYYGYDYYNYDYDYSDYYYGDYYYYDYSYPLP